MSAEAVGFFAMVLLTEMEVFRSVRRHWTKRSLRGFVPEALTKEIDEDVAAEITKVSLIVQSVGPTTADYSLVNSAEEGRSSNTNLAGQNEPLESGSAVGGEIEMRSFEKSSTAAAPVLEAAASGGRDVEDYSLVMSQLGKIYPPTLLSGTPKHALRDLSLALKPGERFGLLGVNGAGKSTTMAILTGDTEPTMGTAFVAGKDLSDPETRLSIGFCPQTDPLLDLMNSYETLWFFGRIRGIPEGVLRARIDALIRDVGLLKHAHRPCGNYSGGNKRKLSLAIALIGDPKLLLLDGKYSYVIIVDFI